MPKINILPFSVANLIAAGEVVDRPASVVKELMENAIDAGATAITVEIQHGGVTFLRVSDNGCGMEPEDLPVAVCRHATSKIRSAEDLDGILTLGFRGEALAATAAVSRMRIISKVKNAEYGAALLVEAGEIISLEEQGASDGTTVIVEDLFYNVPARRKFLKRDATEAMAVAANVEKVALSHPEIAFRLISDGATKLQTSGDGNLKSVIYAIFGKDFASRMIFVEGGSEGIRVSGCIGRSDNVKPNRNYQNYFLNGRYVRSKTACAAVEQAYVSFLPPEKFPACVLYITVNPAAVDVNVHPAKLEVKFSNEKPVFEAIYYTVRAALEENRARPEMRLPDLTPKNEPLRMSAEEFRREVAKTPEKRVSSAFTPVEDRVFGSNKAEQVKMTVPQRPPAPPAVPKEVEKPPVLGVRPPKLEPEAPQREAVPPAKQVAEEAVIVPTERPAPPIEPASEQPTEKRVETSGEKCEAPCPSPESAPQKEDAKQTEPITMQIDEPPQKDEDALPTYRIIGDAFHAYVLVEKYDRENPILLLVDQHAAHERIIFEQMKARMKRSLESGVQTSQLLMLPVEFMLTAAEIEVLQRYRKEVEELGFSYETGVHTVSVSAIPDGFSPDAVPDFLGEIAGRLLDRTGNASLTREIVFEKALYQASCKAAIKAGREYTREHIAYVISELMKLPDITVCPHGRPVAMEISKKAIDRQFRRT